MLRQRSIHRHNSNFGIRNDLINFTLGQGPRGNKSTFLQKYLELSDILFIFAVDNNNDYAYMCKVTLIYDQNNALARRKLADLLATGLFCQQAAEYIEPTPEDIQTHRQEMEAFLENSKKSMSHVIARYL